MKYILIILLFCSQNLFSQKTATLITVPNEKGILKYTLQSSRDTIHWEDREFMLPHYSKDTNKYVFNIPFLNLWYRIKISAKDNILFYSKSKFVTIGLPVTITNYKILNNFLYWTTNNENNVSYYSVEESYDGIIWVETLRILPVGNSTYKAQLK